MRRLVVVLAVVLALWPALVATASPPAAAPEAPKPGMVRFAAGTFVMGSDRGEPDEKPAHRVTLSAFDLDRDEVSAAEYARCVAAGKCKPPHRAPAAPESAVSWVSWEDATAYCKFAGKRLPTEAEWERAARGDKGREYPWGDAADCTRGNFGNFRGDGRCPQNPGRPVAPGRYASGATPEGVRDLAGNVMEWVQDFYDARFYARASTKKPTENPRGPSSGSRRVLRGGGCCSIFGLPRGANRIAYPPDYADDDIGFRCAADVHPIKR